MCSSPDRHVECLRHLVPVLVTVTLINATTGRICVPISIEDAFDFDLHNVPTMQDLIAELDHANRMSDEGFDDVPPGEQTRSPDLVHSNTSH